ncbi:PspC domain-containing protein [Leifsonia sp. NPDC058230]|uniref:PspC domain-containing protein n=1 Tax=Leifsonia sp. NPDC058230 TaxID=3346391 RepID=UPI0036DEE679
MSQHESTPPPPPPPPNAGAGTPSSPYGGPQTGLSGRGTRFFDWMRGLGLVRTDGWIGGVCAAIANRLGIDPIIVRGIVVVAAILGAPVLLLYAAAWALLPDRENRIHLQRLIEGDFQPAIVGIGAMALLSLLPMAQGLWWVGGGFWNTPSWADAVGRIIWTLIVLGALVALVIVATRRGGTWSGFPASASAPAGAPYASTAAPATAAAGAGAAAAGASAFAAAAAPTESPAPASAASDAPASTGAAAGATGTDATVPAAPSLDTSSEPSEPPAPTVGASNQDVADWQARHTAWQAEHAQWKQRLNEDMRAVKAQRSAEIRAQSAALSARAAAERRARRAANPRVGAAVGWVVIGVALVGAALTQALWQMTDLPDYGLTAAFAVATGVFGVAVLIAGLAKRRSGFLIFLGILLAAVTVVSALIPRDRQLVFDGAYLNVSGSKSIAQPYGYTDLVLDPGLAAYPTAPVVDLVKGAGTTTATVPSDLTVEIKAELHGGSLYVVDESNGQSVQHSCTPDRSGTCTLDVFVGPGGTPDSILRIQQTGELTVQILDPDQNEGAEQ